jgi:hypothetical protein
METCVQCDSLFDPLQSVGRLECRAHALPTYRPIGANHATYACCGMRSDRIWHANLYFNFSLTKDAVHGCLRVDHQGPKDKPRTASDMLLFSRHNKAKVAPAADAIPVASLTLAEVQQPDIPLHVNVAAPPHGTVTKNVAPVLEAIIMDAYRDPVFIKTAENTRGERVYGKIVAMQQYDPPGTIEYPDGMDETVFRKMLNDNDAFVTFHLLYNTDYNRNVPVHIMTVRRAAREMDPDVLEEIRRDKQRV